MRLGWAGWGLSLIVLAAAANCGKSKAKQDAGGESVTVTIGEEGGEVDGPGGVGLTIPPGALDSDVEITVSVTTSGFESLPAVSDGAVFAFEPHGLTFNVPVTIRIPHTGVPDEVAMYTASVGSGWSKLEASKGAAELETQVEHFSFFFNGREVCGLYRQECCTPTDGSDGSCAGDALTCVDDRCLECGFDSERCCGTTCHPEMRDGFTLTCNAQGTCEFPYPDGSIPEPADAGFQDPADAGFQDPADAAPVDIPDATPGLPDAL